jgi:hypothetical protein
MVRNEIRVAQTLKNKAQNSLLSPAGLFSQNIVKYLIIKLMSTNTIVFIVTKNFMKTLK